MTKYVKLNNKKIAYSMSGNGFPLIFIHGFCEDRTMWNEFIAPFLIQYRVITVDIGGFGESELPKKATVEEMADQINAVLNKENIIKSILIGHSMGGYIGAAFAEKYKDCLAGLVLFHILMLIFLAKKSIEIKESNLYKNMAYLVM